MTFSGRFYECAVSVSARAHSLTTSLEFPFVWRLVFAAAAASVFVFFCFDKFPSGLILDSSISVLHAPSHVLTTLCQNSISQTDETIICIFDEHVWNGIELRIHKCEHIDALSSKEFLFEIFFIFSSFVVLEIGVFHYELTESLFLSS